MQTCQKCGLSKPLSEFSVESRGYLRKTCRRCRCDQYNLRRQPKPSVGALFESTCDGCGREFAYTYLGKGAVRRNFCSADCRRERYSRPESLRQYSLKGNYGLSSERYDRMLSAQGGGCAICGVTPEFFKMKLAVDHDHSCCPGKRTCGKCVRGILCPTCNNALGGYERTGYIPKAFAKYLMRSAA